MNYLRKIFRALIGISDTPERTALAFAVGIFIGFSPFIGLHTVLGIAVALLFRLNRVAVLVGVWTNVPWITVPFYGFATWFGVQLMGLPQGVELPTVSIRQLFSLSFWSQFLAQWQLLLPAFVGSLVLCTLFAAVAYPLALFVIKRYRRQ